MVWRILFLVWGFFHLPLLVRAGGSGPLLGPYLQSSSPGSISVCVFNAGESPLAVRIWNRSLDTRETPVVGRCPARADFTALVPSCLYSYRLLSEEASGEVDPDGVFWSGTTGEATIIFFGDTRSGDQSFDLDHRHLVETITARHIPDAVVHTGDFVERGDDIDLWQNFFSIERELLATTPIIPVIGQSDQPPDLLREIFPLLSVKPWYSVKIGPVHLVVLSVWDSPNQDQNEVSSSGEQARWLREDLSRARSAGKSSLLVAMHEPAMDIRGRASRAVNEVFIPIFREYEVDAVFSGGHYFSHARREGIDFFTDGGGGAALEKRSPPPGAFLHFKSVHHYLEFRVDREGARVTAFDIAGNPFYGSVIGRSADSFRADPGPTFVRLNSGGKGGSLPLTLFFYPDCSDCGEVEEFLEIESINRGLELTVTFRSLEDAGNRAILDALTDRDDSPPILVGGDRILFGREEIVAELEELLSAADEDLAPPPGNYPWLYLVIIVRGAVAATVIAIFLRRRIFLLLLLPAFFVGLEGAPAEEMGMGQIYREANQAFVSNHYRAALKLYRKAIELGGDSDLAINARFKIALILEENLFDYPAALAAYRDFLDRYPGTRPARLAESRARALGILAESGELELYAGFKRLEAEYHLLELNSPGARAEKAEIGRRIYGLAGRASGGKFRAQAFERAAWILSKEGSYLEAR